LNLWIHDWRQRGVWEAVQWVLSYCVFWSSARTSRNKSRRHTKAPPGLWIPRPKSEWFKQVEAACFVYALFMFVMLRCCYWSM
jgi:hypothetical protein